MAYLLTFISGIVFCVFGIPILQQLTDCLTAGLEHWARSWYISSAEINIELAKKKAELEKELGNNPDSASAIGFEYLAEDMECDDFCDRK